MREQSVVASFPCFSEKIFHAKLKHGNETTTDCVFALWTALCVVARRLRRYIISRCCVLWTFLWTLWTRWEGLGNGMSSAQRPFKPEGGERQLKGMIMIVSIKPRVVLVSLDPRPFWPRFLCWHRKVSLATHTHFDGGMDKMTWWFTLQGHSWHHGRSGL